jgi:DNA polymerase II large subunit
MTLPSINKSHRTYESALLSKFHEILKYANSARLKGYDPLKEVEINIIEEVNYPELLEIGRSLHFEYNYTVDELYEDVLLKCISKAKQTFGFIEPISDFINKILEFALTLLTLDPLYIRSNVINYSIDRDLDNIDYFSVNLNQPYKFLSTKQVILLLVLANELRRMLGISKKLSEKNKQLIEKIASNTEIVINLDIDKELAISEVVKILRSLPININLISLTIGFMDKQLTRNKNSFHLNSITAFCSILLQNKQFLLKLSRTINDSDWDWISNLTGKNTKKDHKKINKIIVAKSQVGGFNLVSGTAQNTSFDTIGIHPSIAELFNNVIVPGSLVEVPGFGHFTVAIVDKLSPPYVKLDSGDRVYLKTAEMSKKLKPKITKVIYCGDLLITPERLTYRKKSTIKPGYNIHQWLFDATRSLSGNKTNFKTEFQSSETLDSVLITGAGNISLEEAIKISKHLGIPLYPKYLLNWKMITLNELGLLPESINGSDSHTNNGFLRLKRDENIISILERLGVEFFVENDQLRVEDFYAELLLNLSNNKLNSNLKESTYNTLIYIGNIFGCVIEDKLGDFVGLSVIIRDPRESLSEPRALSHSLFPASSREGRGYDIISFCRLPDPVMLKIRECPTCKKVFPYNVCPICGNNTEQKFYCLKCKRYEEKEICQVCDSPTREFFYGTLDWRALLENAVQKCQVQPYAPLKGIKRNDWSSRDVERLEKGILRQRNNLLVYKDGIIKYPIMNSPIFAFTPKQVSTRVDKLRELGYEVDICGKRLENDEQFLYIKPQDVIIPFNVADQLRKVADFIDESLAKIYGLPTYYNINTLDDLTGQLIIGQSPLNTSGLLGRIIGFTEANVCFAHPIWHANKGSNCRGQSDYVMLLLDALINFSAHFTEPNTPDIIGTLQSLKLFANTELIPSLKTWDTFLTENDKFGANLRDENTNNELSEPTTILYPKPYSQFTMLSSAITSVQNTSSIKTMDELEIIDTQIKVANLSSSLDSHEVAKNILMKKLLPRTLETIVNYTTQEFKCKNCGKSYRRMTVRGLCISCEKKLQPSFTYNHILRYIQTLEHISSSISIDESTKETVKYIKENFESLFYERKQTSLSDYS